MVVSKGRSTARTWGIACFAALIAIAASSAFAVDFDRPVTFNIPAGALSKALIEFSKQSHVQVLSSGARTRAAMTDGLSGTFTIGEALTRLLKSSGLKFKLMDTDAVAIESGSGDGARRIDPRAAQTTGQAALLASPGDAAAPAALPSMEPDAGKKPRSSLRDESLEEIVITGSHLALPAQQGAVPVQVYTREDIKNSGRTTIAEFMNTLPDVSIALHETEFQTYVGQATVRLHGLPIGTTLLLLNGRRVETSFEGFFDVNNIPASAVERIEVVPIGSSAIYGSDALAGAVNIILRQNFSGLEVNAKQAHAAGNNETDADLAWGISGEKGSISFIGNVQHRDELLGQGRAVTSSIDFPPGSTYVVGDVCTPGTVYSLTGQNLPGLSAPEAAIPAGITGTPTIQDFQPTAGKVHNCNSNLHVTLIPLTRRLGGMLSAHYKWRESLDVFAEGMYTHTYQAYRIGDRIGSSAAYGSVLSAVNPYNPFGVDVGISFADPNIPVSYNNSQTFARSLVGLRGSAFADWHYEVSAFWSRDHNAAQGTFQDFNALNAALVSSDPATALNPFNSAAPGSPQLLQSLNSFDRTAFADQLLGGQGLLRGTLVRLPAGPLQAVFGAEYNREKQFTATPYGAPLDLQRKYYSFFTEERIPLLAARAPARSGEILALTFAGRYDHSSDFGGKATYQGALEWRPAESLLFRGDYATSYKAPDLVAISGGLFASFLEGGLYDPFRGNSSVPLVPVTLGSNPNLQPETGHSKTLGLVYSSRKWRGLELSLTYFSADITNYITNPDSQTVINNPDIFPGAVTRDPPSAQDVQLGYLGPITGITDSYFNFGFIQVAGVDFDLSYKMATPIGELVPSLAVTNTFRWDAALAPHTPAVSYVSQANIYGPGFSPRWKGTLALAWKHESYAANLGARYVGRYKDYQEVLPNSNQLGNFFFYDANFRYDVGAHPPARFSWLTGMIFSVGAVNLFYRLPEFSYSGNAFDSSESDIVGRFLYASVGAKW